MSSSSPPNQPIVPSSSSTLQKHPPSLTPSPNSLPLSIVREYTLQNNNKTTTSIIIPLTIIIQRYADRTFIGISQLNGKIGSYASVSISEDTLLSSSTTNTKPTVTVQTLLGKRDDSLMDVFVRQIAERLYEEWDGAVTAFVIGVGWLSREGDEGREFEVVKEMVDLIVGMGREMMGR